MEALKRALQDRYLWTYKECAKFKYFPTAFRNMVTSGEDIVEVTRRLIHKEGGTDGFATLFLNDRMDLSVEKIILETEYRKLFSQEDLCAAYNRLKENHYKDIDQIESPYEN